jgi:hypothetical protein
VPASLEAAIVFTTVIAPGYLLVRGLAVGRTRTLPERDLYALAQAVVASVIWAAIVYLLFHGLLSRYGLLPRNDARLAKHGVEVGRLLLAFVLTPYFVGRVVGLVYRLIVQGISLGVNQAGPLIADRTEWWARPARWVVSALAEAVRAPTAWDRAWARAADRGQPVVVKLKDGGSIRGVTGASVDLSPLPPRLLLMSGQGFDDNGAPLPLSTGDGGVYIDATEIRAVFLE